MNTERRKILAIPPLLPGDHPIRVLLVDDQVIIGEAVRRALADRCEASGQESSHRKSSGPSVILTEIATRRFKR